MAVRNCTPGLGDPGLHVKAMSGQFEADQLDIVG